MRWAFCGVVCVGVSGCSLLLSSDPNVGVPEDCPTADGDPVTVFEGEGAVTDEWATEPRMIGVRGVGLPIGDDVRFVGGPLALAGFTSNGTDGVLELRFPIDETRPADPQIPESADVQVAVFNDAGECVRVPLRLTFLPELDIANAPINGALLEPRYSSVRLEDVSGTGSVEIVINSASAIEIHGSIDLSGDDGGDGGPGPGGGPGGDSVAGQRDGMFEGGGPGGNTAGSGAGHAVAGEPGDAAGGPPAGHITLLRESVSEARGGHGGGGCAGQPGGHGGGVLIAKAALIAAPESSTEISAIGGNGRDVPCTSGDGSAGAVYLGAQIIEAAEIVVDLSGTDTAAGRVGASGGRLRVDSDDAAFVTASTEAKVSHWLGGGLVAPASRIITGANSALTLEVFGGAEVNRDELGQIVIVKRVDDADIVLFGPDVPPPTVPVDLAPGVNRLCVINQRHDVSVPVAPIDEDVEMATNCIDVGYVP